jgi:adenylate kinase family enzyme
LLIITNVHSNKTKCSIGRSLRTLAESDPKPLTENFAVKESLTAGEMVSKESLDKLVHTNILQLLNKKGIIIDGYPRDINQVYDFEEKVCELKNSSMKRNIS